MRTFIKWPGNKSKHLKYILREFPENYNTYIEPFLGSGAVFLKVQPKEWIINDLNKDLVNVWRTIKKSPDEIIEYFKEFDKNGFKEIDRREKLLLCKKITNTIQDYSISSIDRAKRYLLMKYCAYMGVIIFNDKFSFNSLEMTISRNQYSFLSEKYYLNLKEISEYLKDNEIFNEDYKTILSRAEGNDFVFLDPPYTESHDYFFNYNKGENIGESFIKELFEEIKKLDSKGVKWMMTQADTEQIRETFRDYTIIPFPVYRPFTKTYKNELIIKNY